MYCIPASILNVITFIFILINILESMKINSFDFPFETKAGDNIKLKDVVKGKRY